MAGSLKLMAWTPAESLIEADSIDWVHVELVQSRTLTIWPGHARLMAETAAGTLRYADAAGTHDVELPAGILEVNEDEVLVLLEGALSEDQDAADAERFDRLADALLATRKSDVGTGEGRFSAQQ
jgi:F0F1-type ATP synthase epsilon subunit